MLKLKQSQHGLTLVEAMIALLVVSIGLLGIASLQLTAMTQNSSSLNHSQAVRYAYSMSDRIRANISEFDQYRGIDTSNGYGQSCTGAPCIPAQMREADATDWKNMVETLPGGRGMIFDDDDGVRVVVMWDDDGTGATGTGCNPAVATDLTCYSLVVAQ